MKRPIIKIHNTEKDEIIEREMNDEEFSQHLENLQFFANRDAETEAKATAKASALAKLAALGLTTDEIAAL